MIQIQENDISVSGLFLGRATGFAFEPSWLAHQLNMLYLPIWIASSLLRFTAHRYQLLGISLENVLLAGGLVVMFFSYSRVGWLGLLLVAAYLLLRANLFLIARIRDLIRKRVPVNGLPACFYRSGDGVDRPDFFTGLFRWNVRPGPSGQPERSPHRRPV